MHWYRLAQVESNKVIRQQRRRTDDYEVCPHCRKEIGEKEEYCSDFPSMKNCVHRRCGGKLER